MLQSKGTTRVSKLKVNTGEHGNGLQSLVAHYQKLFNVDENRNHYSSRDFKCAQRKFVKYLLRVGVR